MGLFNSIFGGGNKKDNDCCNVKIVEVKEEENCGCDGEKDDSLNKA